MRTSPIIAQKASSKNLHGLLFLICVLQPFSCIKNDDILVPKQLYDKIEITKFRCGMKFGYMNSGSIDGEILNKTEYIITRLLFRFDLREYDSNCKLKQLYNVGCEVFEMPDFSSFAKKIQKLEKQELFYKDVSKYHNVGSFLDLVNAVNDFNEESSKIILARKVDLKIKIEPNYSVNFKEEIGSTFEQDNLVYTFELQEAYGYKK